VRIFWSVNRSWSGRITASELRRSNFLQVRWTHADNFMHECMLQTVRKLETIDDINKMNDYFSYEHFYVIYCKFWELDRDHNLVIDQIDMAQHANSGENEALRIES
jgi:serine/threonine-protein phosphatase 2A regulatory subunit B''